MPAGPQADSTAARPLAPGLLSPAPPAAPPSAACIRFRADTAGPPTASPAPRPDTPPPDPYRAWPTSPPAAHLSAAPPATAPATPDPGPLPDGVRVIRPA